MFEDTVGNGIVAVVAWMIIEIWRWRKKRIEMVKQIDDNVDAMVKRAEQF